ncbi:IS66 family transposase [Micromonospora sp. Llam0]|uniref:IS66 family transposase n=1 Tax=Micromonospora sp. Llam0 TaxID=2485143 RepID=UPI0018F3063D|nr:IS66 family transposase [Micromonospora sp. Llam0]
MAVTVSAGAAVEADADAGLRDVLARVVQANERWERLAAQLREENAVLRSENERLSAELAVLQRLVFGRSSERVRPSSPAGDEDEDEDGQSGHGGQSDEQQPRKATRRGPGGRAGRRDYSHLPRVEVFWDFTEGGYCCPQCASPFEAFGDHAFEQVDWRVTVRVVVHRRRRYRRRCRCAGARTVTAPGPPKAIGKGRFGNGFIAMLLVERYVAGRSQNSLIIGLARHGADVSGSTLVGTCAAAGTLLAPLEAQIVARNRDSWHLHADETSWHVFTPDTDTGDGPARWWLWVFIAADTTCFVMDPTRAGTVLARHAGIDPDTGQLTPHDDGGPRRLVVSSDFYTVYASAGRKTDGLTNLYCWAHIRRYFVRAGDANPTQLGYWTRDWLDRIKALYAAHDELTDAWNASVASVSGHAATEAATRLADAFTVWDNVLDAIDTARQAQMASPGLQQPAKKALATLDREWDGLAAHRDHPMISLDNNASERALRRPVVTRKNAYGSRTDDAARLAATVWTVTATAEQAGLNPLTYLTAYLDACGHHGGTPLTGPELQRFLPWTASPADLHTWAQPPPTG